MRHGLFAVAVLLLATAAAAAPKKDKDDEETSEKEEKGEKKADKKKGKKDAKGEKGEKGEDGDEEEGGGAGMMDQTAPDPAQTEKADKPEKAKAKRKVVVKGTKEVKADSADAAGDEFVPPRKPLRVFGEVLIGFGGTPLPGPDEDIQGTLFTIRVGGAYDFSKKFTLGLMIPWTTGTVETPAEAGAGSDTKKRNTQALGAPMITAEIRSSLGTHTTLPWGLALGIPVAQGNPDFAGSDTAGITQFLLNAMADANSGWRDGELFAPKRFPVVPFIGIVHEKGRIEGHGFLKFAFLFNTGGEITQAALPTGGGELAMNGTALRTVIGVGGKFWFLKSPKLFGGLELWTAHNTISPVEFTSDSPDPSESGGGDPNPLQWVIEPRVGARFGAVTPTAGFVLPLGGLLSDADAKGLRLGVEANF
jgi:hypothetical protein